MSLSQLTIVGAGLIGGSIALAARRAQVAERIVAIDREEKNTDSDASSHLSGLFDEWVLSKDRNAAERVLKASSLTFLCVPVGTVVALLPSVLEASTCPVSDCGSTKQAICHSLVDHPTRARFVAGHPMAGHPQGGIENARADLFDGKKWILCPEGSDPVALDLVKSLVIDLGAEPLELDSEQHDRSVAITSHVPQIVASALSVHAQQHDALKVAGPGFASATRVAGGAEAMWRDIFATNAEAIGETLVEVSEQLKSLGEELKNHQLEGSLNTLSRARRSRKSEP